jgi:hypothetical protein
MMDLTQAKRDARGVNKAKINALKDAVLLKPAESPIALLPLPITVRVG